MKLVHWDCEWSTDEDTKLLKGVFEYGMGSWEAIKSDPDLGLQDKVRHFEFLVLPHLSDFLHVDARGPQTSSAVTMFSTIYR